MYRPTPKSKKTKYLIIGIALALSGIGYLGYKSLLVKPGINEVRTERRGREGSGDLKDANLGGGTKLKDKGSTLDLSGSAGQGDSGGGRRSRRNRD